MKNEIIVVKVGNDERPAGPEDIKNMKKQLKKLKKKSKRLKGTAFLVTHHAIDISYIEQYVEEVEEEKEGE